MILSKVNKTRKVLRKYKCQTRTVVKRNKKQRGGTISCTKVLGEGAFGIVFNCNKDGNPIAVKFLKKVEIDKNAKIQYEIHENERAMYEYIYDTEEFKGISKENLLKFVKLQKDDIDISDEHKVITDNIIATELCNFDLFSLIAGDVNDIDMSINGQVYRFVNRNTKAAKASHINESIVLYDIAKQIFDGLHALFKMKIVHCDIKPENILVTYMSDKKCIFKICDFGFAAKHKDFNLANTYGLRKNDFKYSRGSKNYMILVPNYIYNTFIKDLTAYAIMLYVLVNLDMPQTINHLSKLNGRVGIFNSVNKYLSSKIDHAFRFTHTEHIKDYETSKQLYTIINDELEAINNKNVGQEKRIGDPIHSTTPISYKPEAVMLQSISKHYSRSLSDEANEYTKF